VQRPSRPRCSQRGCRSCPEAVAEMKVIQLAFTDRQTRSYHGLPKSSSASRSRSHGRGTPNRPPPSRPGHARASVSRTLAAGYLVALLLPPPVRPQQPSSRCPRTSPAGDSCNRLAPGPQPPPARATTPSRGHLVVALRRVELVWPR
jgi:hypothetical protein